MIAHIVFPERRPTHLGVFDYEVPPSLSASVIPGSLIDVPFRSHNKEGVVISLSKESAIPQNKLKKINRSLSLTPVLTERQLQLMNWLSKETGSSLSTTLKAFFVSKPKRATYALQPHTIKSNSTSLSPSSELILCNSMLDYIELIKKTATASQGQVCVIVPDSSLLKKIAVLFPSAAKYTFSLPSGQKFSVWQQVYNNSARLIIGTRNVCYLPFTQLTSVIVVREEDLHFQRQEQHPDYDTNRIVDKLAELHNARALYCSFVPRLATFFKHQNHAKIFQSKNDVKWNVIDKKIFQQKKQSQILPEDLLDFIEQNQGPHVLLYNKKARFRHIECSDCSWTPSCPTCGSGIIYEYVQPGALTCTICKTKFLLPVTCAHCGSTSITVRNPGIEYYADKLQATLKNKNVISISKDTPSLKNLKTADVIIATNFILPYVTWEDIKTLVLLDIDTSLNYPDFRSSEWALQRLYYFASLLPHQAKFFIVTSAPHNNIFKAISSNALLAWYTNELKVRKELHYPPFTELITCSKSFSSRTQKEQETERARNLLENKLKQTVIILQAVPEKKKKGYPGIILIRIQEKIASNIVKKIQSVLDTSWNLKRNPLDLYS